MKKVFLFFLVFTLCASVTFANNFLQTKVQGHLVKIIKYDRLDSRYNIKVAVNADYHATNLRELMERYNAISGVNGVFLCPADYHECGGKNFTHNERYLMGEKIARDEKMGNRVMFAWDKKGEAFLYNDTSINVEKEKDIYYGLANHPLILQGGESTIEQYEDLGLIDRKMKVHGTRNFICTDKNRRYIMTGFVFSATMYQMPEILTELGCYDALNLDAGYTSAMMYNGKQLLKAKRKFLDAVVIERKGLNIKSNNKLIDDFKSTYKKKIESLEIDDKLGETKEMLQRVSKVRAKLYNKNSVDVLDDMGKKIGYEIQMHELNNLTIMYILNRIQEHLWSLQWDLQQEKKKIEENKDREENKEEIRYELLPY